MTQHTAMRIGEIAAATGVSVRLLRYYEEQGLLSPDRTPTGQRLYRTEDVATVGRIRRLLAAGLGTRTIRTILGCACGGTGDVEPCLDPLLLEEVSRLDDELARLAEHRSALTGLLEDKVHRR
ncbi:MerR family transcriptional regulator [Brachybacterium sp. YJGR34]|uniref:MerR family transcriptional regulator n=1 Tax=Brachybacterium sp. YJGR34 TaxID=2059911 RepID=UPI001E4950A1|nr:MerR family transcriptional regulator [Brachybacterium sp. YJGR34]